eukprot:SAG22_NODE_728_length_7596_cov_342.279178_2_plen_546_part_00
MADAINWSAGEAAVAEMLAGTDGVAEPDPAAAEQDSRSRFADRQREQRTLGWVRGHAGVGGGATGGAAAGGGGPEREQEEEGEEQEEQEEEQEEEREEEQEEERVSPRASTARALWLASSPEDDGYEYLVSQGVSMRQINNVLQSLRAAGYDPEEWSDQLLELSEEDVRAVVAQADAFAEMNALHSDDSDDGEEGGGVSEADGGVAAVAGIARHLSNSTSLFSSSDMEDYGGDEQQEYGGGGRDGGSGGDDDDDYNRVIQIVREASAAADPPSFADTVTMLKQATAADADGRCMEAFLFYTQGIQCIDRIKNSTSVQLKVKQALESKRGDVKKRLTILQVKLGSDLCMTALVQLYAPDISASADYLDDDDRRSEATEEGEISRCSICLEGPCPKGERDAITTRCGHQFCRLCLHSAAGHRPLCPLCRAPLGDMLLATLNLGHRPPLAVAGTAAPTEPLRPPPVDMPPDGMMRQDQRPGGAPHPLLQRLLAAAGEQQPVGASGRRHDADEADRGALAPEAPPRAPSASRLGRVVRVFSPCVGGGGQ